MHGTVLSKRKVASTTTTVTLTVAIECRLVGQPPADICASASTPSPQFAMRKHWLQREECTALLKQTNTTAVVLFTTTSSVQLHSI